MIEDLLTGMTPGKAFLWTLTLFVAVLVLRKLQVAAEISRLGTRAPKISFRLPYGMSPDQLGYQVEPNMAQGKLTTVNSPRLYLQGSPSQPCPQGYRILG